MCRKFAILLTILAINCANGAVLLWSREKLHVPSLKSFSDEDFIDLLRTLHYPEVMIYKSNTLSPEFTEIFNGYHTAYSPTGDINTENATEINGDENDLLKIKQSLDDWGEANILSVVVLPSKRSRRDLMSSTTTTDLPPFQPPKGPVLYKAKSSKDYYGLLYASQPLLLKMNNSNLYLGSTSPDLITMDTVARESYTRLNVNIPLEEGGKITLRFLFSWTGGYWSLTTIKITDTNMNLQFDLTSEAAITAPAHFSYHCGDAVVFTDNVNNVELTLPDIQVQIDSSTGKFSDAYDCVPFTTGPIWSGIFVTALLGLGLSLALIAISDIKTMDKFDNHKTKQLAITVTD